MSRVSRTAGNSQAGGPGPVDENMLVVGDDNLPTDNKYANLSCKDLRSLCKRRSIKPGQNPTKLKLQQLLHRHDLAQTGEEMEEREGVELKMKTSLIARKIFKIGSSLVQT